MSGRTGLQDENKQQHILATDRIRFELFSDRRIGQLRAMLASLVVRSEPPKVVEVAQGVLAAEMGADGRPLGARGVCDELGSVLPASLSLRGAQYRGKRDAPPKALLEAAPLESGTGYYLGDLRHHHAHYGHFLLETLSRAWHWNLAQAPAKPVLLCARMPEYVRQFYTLIPGLGERVSLVRRTTRFDRVVVPAPAFVLDRQVHVQFKQLCDAISIRVLRKNEQRSEQPVYLSRAGLDPSSCRTIVGEEPFEQFLADQGFRVVRPETLSIPEQIRLFNTHRHIVAAMGSACHTRVFSLFPTNLVVLSDTRFNPNYAFCDVLNSGSTLYANVMSAPELSGLENLPRFASPLLLNIEKSLSVLKAIGLLPPGAQFTGPPPALREYKERWIQIAKTLSHRPDGDVLRESIEVLERSLADRTRATPQ